MEDNQKLNIGPVRFSYVHVFEPRKGDQGETPKYSVTLLIPKSDTALVERVKAAIQAAYTAGIASVFGGQAPAKGTARNPLRDGDAEKSEDPNYEGMYFINASCKTAPGVVKPNPTGNPKFVAITDQNEFYSGCYGYANIRFYAYNNRGNKGVSAGLNNLLKTRDGEFLGGRANADADFHDIDLGSGTAPAGLSVPNDGDIF